MRLPELPGYKYEDLLGEDPFGWSFVCSHKDGEQRVVKVLKSQATSDQLLYHYFKEFTAPGFDVKGVAPIYDYVFQSTHSLSACAVPFFGWRGRDNRKWQVTSLKGLMRLLTPEQSADVVKKLADNLAVLHGREIFHGGLRPGNVFLTGDSESGHRLQIGDFGQILMGGLQYLEADDLLFYVSPEQLSSGDFSGNNGMAWDTYAFGVIAFQLLTGHLPRLDRLRQQYLENPRALKSAAAVSYGQLTQVSEYVLDQLDLERPVEWPDAPSGKRDSALREIVEKCLCYDAADRPTSMVEVARAMDAAWAVPDTVEPEEPLAEAHVSEIADFAEEEPEARETATHAIVPVLKAAPRRRSKGFRFGGIPRFFAERPALKWQIAAVVALVAILPLSYLSLSYYLRWKSTAAELTVEAKELQANVEKQADAYRRAIMAKQENTEQLKSELNESEDSNSRLLGEAKLARQIVRQTQENGDRFFRLVLENRDTDVPGFREARGKALLDGQKHYERLLEVYGDAPDFIVSTANAYFYLGQIYREMGEFGKALASFGEAERRYLALLEDSKTSDINFVKNIAIAKTSLGQLSSKAGEFSVARHYFTESSRYWAEARSRDASEAANAAIRIHENSLAIVECELAMNRLEAALDAARSVGMQLLQLQEQDPENPRVIGALARSFALTGRVLELSDEQEMAVEAYQQSSDLFAHAVKLDAAVDAYHLGLGNGMARVGLLKNDIEKLEAAAQVLGRVVAANPYEAVYQQTLAEVYGVLASNQRDGGQLKNAIMLEKEALDILQPILAESTSVPLEVRFSYSQRLAHLAELLGDVGEFDESRAPLQEAIEVLEGIAKSDRALDRHHRALARARGLAGFACLKSGDKTGAKEHLELAKSEWETYMAANPDDSDAAQAVKWTNDQLKGLQ